MSTKEQCPYKFRNNEKHGLLGTLSVSDVLYGDFYCERVCDGPTEIPVKIGKLALPLWLASEFVCPTYQPQRIPETAES